MSNYWFLPNLISLQGFDAYLEFLASNNHNFIRMWIVEHAWDEKTGARISPLPWARTGPDTALDGLPKFNLYQPDQAFYDRLRQRVIAARDRGIYVSVMLFGGYWGTEHGETWKGHPFNGSNNINGISGDSNGDALGNEIYTLQMPGVTTIQKAHAKKVIDTLNDLDNVLYEIANEVGSAGTSWQYDMINFVKAYEATTLPKQHPVGMTGYTTPNSDLFQSPADWISPGSAEPAYLDDPPAATGQKVIIIDTDHLWGEGGNPSWVWKSFARGLNPIWMERIMMSSRDLADATAIRNALGYTRTYANKMNLAGMTPRGDLTSTAYALANPGAEYLIYQPNSGSSFTVNLSSGSYSYEWFDPTTGSVSETGNISGGSARSFTAPFSGHAVLYIKSSSA